MDIPHVIHYCWFGRNPLDQKALQCIASWKKYFPDYEIIQWNEDNYDINAFDFTRKAYDDKKWAFVSDVARLKILYDHGGFYFDTDVEVIASYDDILSSDSYGFLGFEKTGMVNTGLGFAAKKGCSLLKDLLTLYSNMDYDAYRDNLSQIACTVLTTELLKAHGLALCDRKQTVYGFDIYPPTYFSPIDYYTNQLRKTTSTHSIHWYSASWLSDEARRQFSQRQKLIRLFGRKTADDIYGIFSCIKNEGILAYLWKRAVKYLRK